VNWKNDPILLAIGWIKQFTQENIMSIEDQAKASVQNVKGKGQEAVGAVTGDAKGEAEGKTKQVLAKTRDGLEDAKDAIADKAKQVADKVHDGVENIKDKLKS
jgi:uncharacterized protein YjbJ (UPF0337 family)